MLTSILNILKNKNLISILLVIYVYMPFIKNIMEDTIGISFFIGYIITICLSIIVIILDDFVISRKVKYFLSFVTITIIINASLVDYYKYVLVEGIQALISIGTAIIIVNSNKFSFYEFIDYWYKFAINNWVIVLITLYLFKINILHYNVFTNICIPNILILSYSYFNNIQIKKYHIFVVLLNLIIIVLFGGRTSAFTSVFMLIVSIFLTTRLTTNTKKFFIVLLVLALILAVYILNNWIFEVNSLLNNFGLRSRNIELLINYLCNNEPHLSGRDNIYMICRKYIIDNFLLPNGFGIVLYLTNGKYYYAHNIFLQLFMQFGICGCIILFYVFFCRIKYIKLHYDIDVIRFLQYIAFIYFIISLTGSSFWIHYLSTIFIAIIFFGNETVYKNDKISKQI